MTALSTDPGRDPERYLAGAFHELTALGTAEVSARIAVQAAAELGLGTTAGLGAIRDERIDCAVLDINLHGLMAFPLRPSCVRAPSRRSSRRATTHRCSPTSLPTRSCWRNRWT